MTEKTTDSKHATGGSVSTRPNFVFNLADDLGYADLGCYGGRVNCSPNLDKMAAEGLRFTNGYANSCVCSPSRFAIATGRYQHRLRGGFDEPIGSVSPQLGLPPELPHDGVAASRCGLCDRARREMAHGIAAVVQPAQERIRRVFRTSHAEPSTFFTHAGFGGHDLWEGDEERSTERLPDRSIDRPGDRFRETPIV